MPQAQRAGAMPTCPARAPGIRADGRRIPSTAGTHRVTAQVGADSFQRPSQFLQPDTVPPSNPKLTVCLLKITFPPEIPKLGEAREAQHPCWLLLPPAFTVASRENKLEANASRNLVQASIGFSGCLWECPCAGQASGPPEA